MKKLAAVLCLLALLCLAGCGGSDAASVTETAASDTTTTLMIYMIGSDLEAQAGAGSRDLQEIAASGVDLDRVNVVVYAGGSPHWHNESASAEEHTLLLLTAEGFTKITSTAASSMGGAECLTNFLNYGVANFPADEYALILWDHGDGPVIGYGKDMLFDNDSLTLQEMAQALENSPFGETQKLSWVGFDACLMASAELACVWAPYADYLVASQEVEPSFGWDYDFLSHVGQQDTPTLMHALTDSYLAACLEYYESRGYENRDTTLSCMDLSYAPQLNEAINALFSKAAQEVDANYNTLTAKRVQTRALGRASTGSEYDLIDLNDMAAQLLDVYPEEAGAIRSILESMVVANATNAENCCGLSLYYPFYNKYYFEESWGAVYDQLGLFPEYLNYLQNYQTIWLQNDMLENASSEIPEVSSAGSYTLQLTEEQAETFASARYYILVRDGEEYFTRIYSSHNVTNRDGLLTANFDGNVLYAKDNFGNYQIPVAIEHDTVNGQTRYSVYATLSNYSLDLLAVPEDLEFIVQAHRFGLSIDNRTKEVTVNSLVPYDHQTGSELLTGGKLEDTDLSDWACCLFVHDDHRYLSRYENGAIMPVEQWDASTMFSAVEFPVENGIEFVCAPLVKGEYYLLFEVEDTQGNRYCSELLPIQADGQLEEPAPVDPIDVSWTEGDRVLLTEQAGVTVYLEKKNISILSDKEHYVLTVTNNNDFPVHVNGTKVFWNENILCDDHFSYLIAEPGQTVTADSGTGMGTFAELGLWKQDGTLSFSLEIQNSITGAYLLPVQTFRVAISARQILSPDLVSTESNRFDQPLYHALAREQVLLDTAEYKVTLLGLGGNGQEGLWAADMNGVLCIENHTDHPLILEPIGAALNGVYVDTYTLGYADTIPAHSKTYQFFEISSYKLEPAGITSIADITLLLQRTDYSPLFSGNSLSELFWCPLNLAQSGPASPFEEGGQVLFEENGIRVSLLRSESDDEYHDSWYLTIVNDTDRDISLGLTDIVINGVSNDRRDTRLFLSDAAVGAHQKAVCELSYSDYNSEMPLQSASFRFWVMDFLGESILFTGSEEISLSAP